MNGDRDGRLVVRYVSIAALGHAWSGGDDALPFNDAQGPDATAMVARIRARRAVVR